MEQQRTIHWEVEYVSPPHAVRYCKKCGKRVSFEPSGMFRINAQRRYLDIWLIYKCRRCQTTWNMTVFSRINPAAVSGKLLERFYINDSHLAAEYAVNVELLEKNGSEIELPRFEVRGEDVTLGELRATGATLIITSPYPNSIKLSAVLKKKLGLSSKEWKALEQSDGVFLLENANIKKCKIARKTSLKILKNQ